MFMLAGQRLCDAAAFLAALVDAEGGVCQTTAGFVVGMGSAGREGITFLHVLVGTGGLLRPRGVAAGFIVLGVVLA